jgi:hypothetical protein
LPTVELEEQRIEVAAFRKIVSKSRLYEGGEQVARKL